MDLTFQYEPTLSFQQAREPKLEPKDLVEVVVRLQWLRSLHHLR